MKIVYSRLCLWVAAFVLSLILTACAPKLEETTAPPLTPILPSENPPTATAIPLDLPYEEAVHLFDYDNSFPLDIQEISVDNQTGVTINDITYASQDARYGFPIKGRISAFLVTPTGEGPFSGVVFMHWLGNPNGNRHEFLDEAIELAGDGVISILVDGIFPWITPPSSYEVDRLQIIQQVVTLRQAVDVLYSMPEVETQRIGFVGHDYGAMYGGILAGVEPRIKTYILMAGMGSFSDWSLKYWPLTGSKGVDKYRQAMAVVDPLGYVSHAAPASLFYQFAKNDTYISEEAAQEFYTAGSDPKQIQWYDTSHNMNTEKDRSDRKTWLLDHLGK
jgi:dienelactone hydrolase